jgi:predicted RND superfamily exporter protein
MTVKQENLDRFSWVVVRYRFIILSLLLVCVGVFALGALKIKNEVILRDLFPYDHPYLKLNARFSEVFGGGGFGIVIAVKSKKGDIFNAETLGKIKGITDELTLWDEVYRVLTVSMASNSVKVVKTLAKGEIVIDSLMFPDIPQDDAGMQLLKKHIFSNSSYNGTLVSRDGSAALIFTQIKEDISYEHIFSRLRALDRRYSDKQTSIHVVGYPILLGWIYSYKAQMYWVFAISVGFMIAILFAIFRNLVGMVAPIAMALICTCLGLGFIGWMGINFSPLLYVLAFLVGARMLSNSVQITHRYLHEYAVLGETAERRRTQAAYETMRVMLVPNVAAVATDAAGFLILGLAKIVLMQQLAIMMGFWMLTIALSGIFVPIICSCLPPVKVQLDKKVKEANPLGFLDHFLMSVARFSVSSRGRFYIILVTLIILFFGGWQTAKLKVGDPTPGSPILWPSHPYNVDQALVNSTFDASSENFMLFYEGKPTSVYDPIVLKTFESFDRHMRDKLPDIYKSSSSIINIGKILNLTLHDGDQVWNQMPLGERELTGLLGYIRNNIDRGTLGRFMDSTLERAQITIYFADHTSDNLRRIGAAAANFFKKHSMKTEHGQFMLAGGAVGLEMAVNAEMRRSHMLMDSMVLVVIFIMCMIAFRSVVAGLMLALPLILSNFIAFSYMSFADIGLSTNTLPCSAVGVGVGVDFAIYLYSRCIEEYPRCQDWQMTVLTAVRTAGKGIFFTGITLILPILTWYFISALKFQAQMGFFLSMLLFVNMVAALTLHPLMILLFKPKFMQVGMVGVDKVAPATKSEMVIERQ